MRIYKVISLLSIVFITKISSSKILGIFPYAWGSHYILGIKLMKGLAEAGHDITFVSPYPTKDVPISYNWTDVVLEGQPEVQQYFKEQLMLSGGDTFKLLEVFSLWSQNMTKAVLTHTKIDDFIKSGHTFDAILADPPMDCIQVLSHLLNAPFIILSTVGPLGSVSAKALNPSPISTTPSILHYISELKQTLSFTARLKNLFIRILEQVFAAYTLSYQSTLLRELFPDSPSFQDIYYNVSLILLNSHPSIIPAEPLVPNMIEIGGFHIDSSKALPRGLQEFLDGAKDGAIYFSMGSEISSRQLSEEKQKAFLQVFAGLKQRIVWKFDRDISGKPENVLIESWLPQQDILAHPNVKLFIMQGGLLSTTESIHNGKPTLCIPLYGDQGMNCHVASQAGYSLQIDFNDISSEKLKPLIEELLRKPQYTNTAKRLSTIYHDRPMTPLQTAIYWVEYVIRHKGAPHLKVAGVGMPLYKYHMIDVIVVVAGCIIALLVAAKWLIKFLVNGLADRPKGEKLKTT